MERQRKVLVVDDDQFALRGITGVLVGQSYQVVTAASGSEAIDLLKQDSFDLVLTDLDMPEIDGFEVLRQAREIAPQAVVLVLTGYASLESAIEALRGGAYDYLVKPCSDDELKLKIERGLERFRLTEERKRVDEALLAAAQQWRTTFDAINDMVFLIDVEGRILRCNMAMKDFVGKPFNEIVGCTCWKLVHGTSERPEGCPAVRMWETCRRESQVLPIGDRWFEIAADPLLDEDGSIIGSVHIMSDVTERLEAEEALGRLAVVMADSNDAITIQDFDGTVIAWNQGAERMYGYSEEEALGGNFDDMIPEEKRAEFHELVAQIQSGNLIGSLETHRLTRDGRMLDVRLTVSPLTDDRGSISAISTTERDITERKRVEEELRRYRDHLEKLVEQRTTEFIQAIEELRREIAERKRVQEALRQSEEELRAIFDGARDGIIVLDKTGKVVRINKYVEVVGGYTEDELVGKRIDVLEMVPSQSMAKIMSAYSKLEKGQDAPPYEIEVYLKTGEKRISEVHSSLARRGGGVVGIVGIMRDITERKQAEEAIKQRNRELAALLEASQRLASRLDLDELLSDIARSVVETLPSAEASSLWLYDERPGELVVRAWSGYDDEVISGLSLPLDTSLVGLVHRTRQPHIVDDVARELAFEVVDRPGLDVICAALGVPLLVEGQSIGALFADNFSRPQAFNENDLRLLQSLAAQAAAAIHNAQLFEQVCTGRERLQALSRRLVEVQEAERRYIALELHDEIGQILTGLKLSLEVATRLPTDEIMPSLNKAKALLNELIIQVDDLSLDLRPAMLDDLGLLPALLWHFDRYTTQTNVRVTFQHIGLEGRRFEAEIETAAYRIVQEALTNVARHAGVSEVVVRTWADQETLGVQIEDHGAGFDPEAVLAAGDTTGLPGMRDRAALLSGQLTVESAPGAGTRLMTEFSLGYCPLERRGMQRDEPDENRAGG